MEWKHLAGNSALSNLLGIPEHRLKCAKHRTRDGYVETTTQDKRTGKPRNLCFPPHGSVLREVQVALNEKILSKLELLDEVQGYRIGSHNVEIARVPCGYPHVGKVDIHKFHPSIHPGHVASALYQHGLSQSWARIISEFATYKNSVPQGAPTSNHVANLVMDSFLRRYVKKFADDRGVGFVNYGDDIAFYGRNAAAVRQCVAHSRARLKEMGFSTNEKTRDCEHRGDPRTFVGCSTSRLDPDYPRADYRAYRKTLRKWLSKERAREDAPSRTTVHDIRSIRSTIAYIGQLSVKKERALLNVFHRIRAAAGLGIDPNATDE